MILGMIDLTTHDEKTLRVVEGQVLDDSKNTIIKLFVMFNLLN